MMSEVHAAETAGMAADPNHPYAQDISFLHAEQGVPQAGPWWRLAAVVAFSACAAVNTGLMLRRGGAGAEVAGAALGSLLWPMLVVGVYALWRGSTTQRQRYKVFVYTCLALLLVPALTYAGIRLYGHYTANADLTGLSFEQVNERATHCLRQGDVECTATLWQRYTELHPDEGAGFVHHAVALARLERHAEATIKYERALTLGEGAYDLFAYYAESLARSGRTEEAIDWFYKTLAVAPGAVDARARLAKLLLGQQRPYEALSLLQAYDVRHEASGKPGYFAAQRMSIEAGLSRDASREQDTRLLRLPMYAGHYYAPLAVGASRPTAFVVDTGATLTTFSSELLESSRVPHKVVEPRVKMRTADGRTIHARGIVVSSVRLGPFELKDVAAVVCDGCEPLLGQSTLVRFDLQSTRHQGMDFLTLRQR